MAARVGAVLLAVQPLYIVAELVTAAAVRVPYSLVDNTISSLGATQCTTLAYPFGLVPVCSPRHALINTAFVVFGLLLGVGMLLLRGWLPPGPAAVTAIVLWLVSGLSTIATGLVPFDRNLQLHAVVAMPVMLAPPMAVLATAWVMRHRGALARAGWSIGIVALVGGIAYLGADTGPSFGGLFERLAVWPCLLWLPFLAFAVTRQAGPQPDVNTLPHPESSASST